MKTLFRSSFEQDLKNVKPAKLLARIKTVIEQAEDAVKPADIPHLTKLAGAKNCFRIRVGDLRLGVIIEGDTVEFVRCLHRKDLYKYFPG